MYDRVAFSKINLQLCHTPEFIIAYNVWLLCRQPYMICILRSGKEPPAFNTGKIPHDNIRMVFFYFRIAEGG